MPKTPQEVDRINAQFAEYAMGWMAVGKRRRSIRGSLGDEDVWMGVPARDDVLRDVENYWQRLENAWKGLSSLPADAIIHLERREAEWLCSVTLPNLDRFPEPLFPNSIAWAKAETLSRAIVKCLLNLAGHPLPEPEE